MHPMDAVAGMAEWLGPDLAYNLEFIPEDRLEWKPAPEAKSALACAAEAATVTRAMLNKLSGKALKAEMPAVLSKEQVQADLEKGSAEYAAAVRAIPVEKLSEQVVTEWGTLSLQQLAAYVVVELSHHRGQLLYIQTLLGDTESHFKA